MIWDRIDSKQDASVNWIANYGNGKLEARYVRREDDYFIVYLSSHSGCKLSCRFCHLTATGQTSMENVGVDQYIEQAEQVFAHYLTQTPAKIVHFNWMARGDVLANPVFVENAGIILNKLSEMSASYNLEPKFKLSTILPIDWMDRSLNDYFSDLPIDWYYSLYSLDKTFRKRWLPKAISGELGLDKLKAWQEKNDREIILHWAFIAGQNDDVDTVNRICDAVQERELKVRFNVVRYNPFDNKSAESSDEIIQRNFEIMKERFGKGKIVPRVGFDARASCGMFF